MPCDIFVPAGAPITKIEACRAYGATVVEGGASLDEAMTAARQRADDAGMAFCHPFDDPAVVAGQGTLGLELVEDLPDLACVIVPVGGGGLAAGTAIAVKSLRPDVRVVGVQAAVCAPYAGGDVAGRPGRHARRRDRRQAPRASSPARSIAEWVDELVAVDEDAIADAMVVLMDRAKLYVEGAGAVGVAAVAAGLVAPAPSGTTCVVLSGGNVDLGIVPGLIRRHETTAGRRLVVFARIDDRPGSLVRLLGAFAAAGANLVEVQHQREGVDLHVRETGVHATFEVRSRDHAELVLAAVRAAGYPDLGHRGDVATRPASGAHLYLLVGRLVRWTRPPCSTTSSPRSSGCSTATWRRPRSGSRTSTSRTAGAATTTPTRRGARSRPTSAGRRSTTPPAAR